ncbi:MAG: type II toxin-antitoxin system VapC family toxin [Candidatus Binatia bacterium]
MARVVLDASVLIGFLYEGDEHHDRCRAALQTPEIVEAEWVVPATTCAEVLVGAYRGSEDFGAMIERFFEEGVERIEPITHNTAQTAARMRARSRRLSLADALVLATAQAVDADLVITADRDWSRLNDRVRVV